MQLDGYELGRLVEQRGMDALLPFMEMQSFRGRFSLTTEGPSAKGIQAYLGDAVMNTGPKTMVTVEIKCEASNHHQNFFLEEWSNLNFCMRKPGWMVTSGADVLWYYFIEQDELYIINFRKLFEWAYERDRLKSFRLVKQGKHQQLNVTAGRPVPIEVIRKEVGFVLHHPRLERKPRASAAGV